MWRKKKSHTAQAADSEPANLQTNQPTKVPRAFWERTPKMNNDAIRPSGPTADRATARLGASMHVKGEISGNDQEGQFGERRFDNGADHHRRRSILQGLDLDREERGKGMRQKRVLADRICTGYTGSGRGAEKYLITKECLGSYAQDKGHKWFS